MAEILTQITQIVDSQVWSKTKELSKQANQTIQNLKSKMGPVFAKQKLTNESVIKEATDSGGAQFQNTLDEMELTTKLQTPRLYTASRQQIGTGSNEIKRTAPEKYKFIPFLVKKGIGTEEIAEAMAISQIEAQQLVTLAKIGTRK